MRALSASSHPRPSSTYLTHQVLIKSRQGRPVRRRLSACFNSRRTLTYSLLLALQAIVVKSQTFVHCLSSPASRCSPFEATVTPNSMEQAHVTLFRDWRHSYYLFSSSSGSHLIYFPRQPPSQVQQLLQSPALSVKQGSGLARRWIFTLPPLNVLPRRISLRMRRKTRETIASRQLRPRPLLPSTRDLIANASRISSGRSL